jgi:hypothetical protein
MEHTAQDVIECLHEGHRRTITVFASVSILVGGGVYSRYTVETDAFNPSKYLLCKNGDVLAAEGMRCWYDTKQEAIAALTYHVYCVSTGSTFESQDASGEFLWTPDELVEIEFLRASYTRKDGHIADWTQTLSNYATILDCTRADDSTSNQKMLAVFRRRGRRLLAQRREAARGTGLLELFRALDRGQEIESLKEEKQ